MKLMHGCYMFFMFATPLPYILTYNSHEFLSYLPYLFYLILSYNTLSWNLCFIYLIVHLSSGIINLYCNFYYFLYYSLTSSFLSLCYLPPYIILCLLSFLLCHCSSVHPPPLPIHLHTPNHSSPHSNITGRIVTL